MACLLASLVLLGFSRRYLFPVALGSFEAPAIVHVHGIISLAWMAFFILQCVLVATGRISQHRSMGLAGIAMGTLLIYTAAQVAILLLARELKEGGPSPREFSATLLSMVLLVACLFGTAIATVNKPEVHKRLMMLAILVTITPALARIVQMGSSSMSRLARNDLASVASDALVLFVVLYDARQRGRLHPAYVWGGTLILVVQIAAFWVRPSHEWYAFTNWLAALVGL
jgi:hypothetical protein